MVIEDPAQMVALDPTVAEANDITTVSVFEHPVAAIVSVKKYDVVLFGLTFGLELLSENPNGELAHEYLLPDTAEAPIVKGVKLEQIAVLAMVLAAGKG